MSTLPKSNCHFFLVGKIQDELEQFVKKHRNYSGSLSERWA